MPPQQQEFERWLRHFMPSAMLIGHWENKTVKGEKIRLWRYNDISVGLMWMAYQRGLHDAKVNSNDE